MRNALKELFSPGVLVDTLKGIQGIVAAHQAGVQHTSATYGRLLDLRHADGEEIRNPVS